MSYVIDLETLCKQRVLVSLSKNQKKRVYQLNLNKNSPFFLFIMVRFNHYKES